MRKLILTIVLLLIILPTVFAFPDEPDGFRGIKWETPLSSLKEQFISVPDRSASGVDYYIRKDDELKLGQAILDKIVYGFWQGKFYNVELNYTSYNSFIGVKDAATARFGQPEQPYWSTPVFVWNGARAGILLDHNSLGQRGKLLIYSKTIHKEKERLEKERAKQDAQKGF